MDYKVSECVFKKEKGVGVGEISVPVRRHKKYSAPHIMYSRRSRKKYTRSGRWGAKGCCYCFALTSGVTEGKG